MRNSRFSEELIIAILRMQEAGGTADVCRKHGISSATIGGHRACRGVIRGGAGAKQRITMDNACGYMSELPRSVTWQAPSTRLEHHPTARDRVGDERSDKDALESKG